MDAEPLFLRGKEAVERGDYDYAISLFRDVLKMDPSHRNGRIALRGCEMKKFDATGGLKAKVLGSLKGIGPLAKMTVFRWKPETVVDAAEAYLVNDPTSVHVLVALANALEKLEHLDAAADTLEFARQRNPNQVGVLYRLGEVLAALGQYERAVRCYQTILTLRPNDREAAARSRSVSAESHLKRSHLEESQTFREQLRDQTTTKTLAQADRMVRTTEEVDQDIAQQKKSSDENPNDPEALMRLGEVLGRSDRLVEAEAAYRKSFEISKKWAAREKLGDTHLRLLEQAEQQAKKVAEESGRDPSAVARAHEATHRRLEFAVKEFELRRKQHPTEARLAWQLGQYYFELGGEANVQQAIQQFQQAVSSVPLKARAQLMLGRCFALNPKTLDMAKEQFVKAYEAMEDDQSEIAKSLLYELGATCEKMGSKPDALAWYKKIFAVDAGYRDVSKKIQQLG
ncbi:MAG: tetratricopeptide repeat protein [Candidatus Brocadiia bacterium]